MPEKKWRDRFIQLARAHSSWVLGFVDEVWWSRRAQPRLHAWTATKPLGLLHKEPDTQELEPKAMAGDGVWRADTPTMLWRVVDGRPVSGVTTQFLGGLTEPLAQETKPALWVVWDHASWHSSRTVRSWITVHNRRVKREGGGRLWVCPLPSTSPWRNRLEPK